MAEEKAAKAPATQQYVQYVGSADVRTLRAGDWAREGAAGQSQVRWDGRNEWLVPSANLSPEALAFAERSDEFSIVEL